MSQPPDRTTVSFPVDADVDLDVLDDLVEQSDHSTRSAVIREAIRSLKDEEGRQ